MDPSARIPSELDAIGSPGQTQWQAEEGHKPIEKATNDNRIAELISLLSTTLANIDVEYDFELARIRVTAKPEIRAMIVDTVRQRHIARREPYVCQITELRKRMGQR